MRYSKIPGQIVVSALLMAGVLQGCARKQDPEEDDGVPKAPIGKIQFGSHVSQPQYEALGAALQTLDAIRVDNPSDALLALLRLQDASPQSLRAWLEDRVQFIVPENFDIGTHVRIQARDYGYPNPGVVPVLEPPTRRIGQVVGIKLMMLNIGGGLYVTAKEKGVLAVMKLEGVGDISITSPRVGILEIGDGMFIQTPTADQVALNIFRLSILFHEARHSDGNGKSTAFFHAVCPAGNDYAGVNACDRNVNGPYTVGGTVLKNLLDSCVDCSAEGREKLRLNYLDTQSRIIGGDAWDDAPEGRR